MFPSLQKESSKGINEACIHGEGTVRLRTIGLCTVLAASGDLVLDIHLTFQIYRTMENDDEVLSGLIL